MRKMAARTNMDPVQASTVTEPRYMMAEISKVKISEALEAYVLMIESVNFITALVQIPAKARRREAKSWTVSKSRGGQKLYRKLAAFAAVALMPQDMRAAKKAPQAYI